jgi:hypothetical protein
MSDITWEVTESLSTEFDKGRLVEGETVIADDLLLRPDQAETAQQLLSLSKPEDREEILGTVKIMSSRNKRLADLAYSPVPVFEGS